MAEDGRAQSMNPWPMPKFYFIVQWDSTEMHFQEVSGLDAESAIVEYCHTDSPSFSTTKMPGIQKYSNVTLKRGVIKNDNKFWDWFNQVKMNTIKRASMTISLLDEEGKPTMVWALSNAWPVKISSTELRGEGNEVAVETLEIAYEGLSIA